MTAIQHTKENCNCPYATKPKKLGRAHWVCPFCERDVSLEWVLLNELREKKK